VAERERKRDRRRRQQPRGVSPPIEETPKTNDSDRVPEEKEPLSLSGFDLEVQEMMRIILENWDKISRCVDPMSLAGLNRQLFDILQQSAQKVRQVGQKRPHVPGRLDFSTT
jgi:hypothetical protein